MRSEHQTKLDMIEIGKRLHGRGWISSTDGNFSVKLGENRIITTPTGVHKGYLTTDDFVIVNMKGEVLEGNSKPSSELLMHLTCYRERPDICSVIHAHPTYCIVLSVAGIKLAKCLLPEVLFTLGSIPTADYAPPTTEQVATSVQEPVRDFDAIILERHGSLNVGKDIFDTYNKLERMEHVAEITYHAQQLGRAEPLSDSQVSELMEIKDGLGMNAKPQPVNCNSCNSCGKYGNSCKPSDQNPVAEPLEDNGLSEEMVEYITREVIAELQATGGGVTR